MTPRPCADLRVLDFGTGYGAIPGMILADYGADVIKIEPCDGEAFRGHRAFRQWNRGKRGLPADLNKEAERSRVQDLAARADVIIDNFRPEVMERLGLGFETVSQANPGVVSLSITGFGSHSRYGHVKGYEGVVAAATGQFLIQNGYRDDGPIYDAIAKCSFGASMLGLIGTLAALEARTQTGIGQQVRSSLVQANFVYSYGGIKGETPSITEALSMVQGRDPHNTMPGYRIAQCGDGKWVQSGSAGGRIFENLMRALEIDMFFADPRYENGPARLSIADRDELIAAIDAAYATRPLHEWIERLDDNDAAYGLFATTQGFMAHPQVVHNGHVIDVTDPDVGPMKQVGPLVSFVGADWQWPGPAPSLDQAGPAPEWIDNERHVCAPADRPLRGPLDGITVLDLANFAAAPGGPGLMGDLGAQVIKVEPIMGDPMVAGAVDAAELFARINRSKERISIDLKNPLGQEILHRLVAEADVVVHNYRPGVPERLGLDFETLREHNPRLIYVYGASFGSTGPDSRRPAFDAVMSAMAGGEVLQAGRGNPPQQRQTTDHSALLGVGVAMLLGLRERDRTGEAQQLETTMLCSAAYLMSDDFIQFEGKDERPIADAGQYGLNHRYRLYRTADDGWVFLACPTDDEWERFCLSVGHPGWVDDERFSAAAAQDPSATDIATALVAEVFAGQSADAWETQLLAVDVACVRATRTWVDYLFAHDPGLPEDFVTSYDTETYGPLEQCGLPINLSATPGHVGPLQALGESTQPLLEALGYDEDAISALRDGGVVRAG